MTIAPAFGPDPVDERTSPMASRIRIASRTEAREMPNSSARWRSPGSLSPTEISPERRRSSSQSRTTVYACGCGHGGLLRRWAGRGPV